MTSAIFSNGNLMKKSPAAFKRLFQFSNFISIFMFVSDVKYKILYRIYGKSTAADF